MGTTIKMVIGGLVLFGLGGLSVYVFTSSSSENTAIAEETAPPTASYSTTTPTPTESTVSESNANATTTESFYAAAEARREQYLADKEEADRLAKLQAIKERSVECKFWKQQQKTSSAAAKIEEKIQQHCTLQTQNSTENVAEKENNETKTSG